MVGGQERGRLLEVRFLALRPCRRAERADEPTTLRDDPARAHRNARHAGSMVGGGSVDLWNGRGLVLQLQGEGEDGTLTL